MFHTIQTTDASKTKTIEEKAKQGWRVVDTQQNGESVFITFALT